MFVDVVTAFAAVGMEFAFPTNATYEHTLALCNRIKFKNGDFNSFLDGVTIHTAFTNAGVNPHLTALVADAHRN